MAAIEAQAAAKVADASSTAAIEAVAGILSRALADAEVIAEPWAAEAVSPVWLMQVGRSLIRPGESLSVIDMNNSGRLELVPAAFWNFEAPDTPRAEAEHTWHARVTTYGPSSSRTRLLDRDQLVFVRWGTSPGTRYRGQGPQVGRISPPGCKARPNGRSATNPPGRSPIFCRSHKTAATAATTTRSPC